MNATHLADGLRYLRSAMLGWIGFAVASWLGMEAERLGLPSTAQNAIEVLTLLAFAAAFLFTNLTIVERVLGRNKAY